MVRVLFRSFDLGKWCVIAFTAFLATCGEGAGGGMSGQVRNLFGPHTGPRSGVGIFPANPPLWISTHLPIFLLIAVPIGCFALALSILLAWLGSRGRFMFVAALARNRAEVARPWREFAGLANSLFLARLVLLTAWWVLVLPILIIGLVMAWPGIAMAWPNFQSEPGRAIMILALIPSVVATAVLLLGLGITLVIARWVLEGLVMPTMYAQRVRAWEAWRIVRQRVLPGNGGTVVLFYLLLFVLGFAAGIMMIIGTCCLCCKFRPYPMSTLWSFCPSLPSCNVARFISSSSSGLSSAFSRSAAWNARTVNTI